MPLRLLEEGQLLLHLYIVDVASKHNVRPGACNQLQTDHLSSCKAKVGKQRSWRLTRALNAYAGAECCALSKTREAVKAENACTVSDWQPLSALSCRGSGSVVHPGTQTRVLLTA